MVYFLRHLVIIRFKFYSYDVFLVLGSDYFPCFTANITCHIHLIISTFVWVNVPTIT